MIDDDRPRTLEELDCDGAIQEAASKVDSSTRATFMRRAGAFIGGGAIVAGLPVSFAMAASLPSGDVSILNYALTLEYLEAAFYAEAVSKGALTGETKTLAGIVAQHEAAHVAAIKSVLGSQAVKKPNFNFQGTTSSQSTFQTTSMTVENLGVTAYLGQVGNIKTPAVLSAAGSILPVEARHAAWITNIIGNGSGNPLPASEAFQPSATMASVLATVKSTGFISDVSGSSGSSSSAVSGSPSFTG
jgi:hypothetical protein